MQYIGWLPESLDDELDAYYDRPGWREINSNSLAEGIGCILRLLEIEDQLEVVRAEWRPHNLPVLANERNLQDAIADYQQLASEYGLLQFEATTAWQCLRFRIMEATAELAMSYYQECFAAGGFTHATV